MKNTCIRIHTSPAYTHIKEVRSQSGEGPKKYESPLQRIERMISTMSALQATPLNSVERIRPVVVAPWWTPPTIHIAADKETAIKDHARTVAQAAKQCLYYTDGSAIRGEVGSAVYAPREPGGKAWSQQRYVGPFRESNVYAAELYGIYMALKRTYDLLRRSAGRNRPLLRRIVVFSDSQSALLSCRRPDRQSGQHILETIAALISKLRKREIQIELRWIPGHADVEGNEVADVLAKEATGWRPPGDGREQSGPRAREIVGRSTLRSAYRRHIQQAARGHWRSLWESSPAGAYYRLHFDEDPYQTAKTLRTICGKLAPGKAQSSILVQARTGKIGLNGYLAKINKRPTSSCRGCGEAVETVQHVLCECPEYAALRKEVFGRAYIHAFHTPLRNLLSSATSAANAAHFLRRTGLLTQFRNTQTQLYAEKADENE